MSFRTLGLVVTLAAAAACSSSTVHPTTTTGGTPPLDAGWQSHLADTLVAAPLYSLRFLDRGPILSAVFVAGAPGDNCSALEGTFAELDGGDIWLLAVVLPSADVGAYPVVSPIEPFGGTVSDAGALVYLEHLSPTNKRDYVSFASGGAITVSSVPVDGGDQRAGAHLIGALAYVGFPSDPIALGQCTGRSGSDGGVTGQPEICTCDDLDGNQVSVCDGGPEICCASAEPAKIQISLSFDATPCAILCTTDPDLDPSVCPAP